MSFVASLLLKKYFQSKKKKKSETPIPQIIVIKWNNYIIGILYVNKIIIIYYWNIMYSVQLLSHVWHFATPWITAHQASLSINNSQSLPKLIHQVGDAI